MRSARRRARPRVGRRRVRLRVRGPAWRRTNRRSRARSARPCASPARRGAQRTSGASCDGRRELETLPSSIDLIPPRPRDPSTMVATRYSPATLRIVSTTGPEAHACIGRAFSPASLARSAPSAASAAATFSTVSSTADTSAVYVKPGITKVDVACVRCQTESTIASRRPKKAPARCTATLASSEPS